MYNKSNIMRTAHKFYKAQRFTEWSDCLKAAWINAKAIKAVVDEFEGEELHTWYGWTELGYEVIHESKAVAQVKVFDAKTKSGTRVLSYFTREQVCELGSQPYAVA